MVGAQQCETMCDAGEVFIFHLFWNLLNEKKDTANIRGIAFQLGNAKATKKIIKKSLGQT